MKKQKSLPKRVTNPTFLYHSLCCQSIAEKPACSVPQNAKIGTYLGAIPPDDRQVGLGSWGCSTCRKSCKVQRTAKKEVVPVQAELTA